MTMPGERDEKEILDEMIRVDHAGEYGARRIYEGQLAVLKNSPSAPIIKEMQNQELVHLEAFDALVKERRVRPTALMPLWHVGGYALGAVTALMGEKAAMACTVAVESVIDEHYAEQEEELEQKAIEPELKAMIAKFRAEEQEHHDLGLEHGAEDAIGYEMLRGVVEGVTRTAIFLSKKI